MKRLLFLICAAVLTGACASSQAKVKSPAEHPALEVPPVPPRVVEPVQLPPPPPEPVPDLPASPPAKTRQQPARDAKPATDPARTEPPVEMGPPTPPVAPPAVPPLRTTSTPDSAAERQVNDLIKRALTTLGSVDWGRLDKQQQAQYDNAQLFLKQAAESVKAQNYEFARNLAEKAEKIARELGGK